jgi:hypothetical protein
MKRFWEGLLEWKTAASLMFTGSVALYSVISTLAGEKFVAISILVSLLIVSSVGTFIQFAAFTDFFIKKVRYTYRMVIFAVPFFVMLSLNAYFFKWFEGDPGHWALFVGIFLVIFVGMSVGFEIYYRAMGRKYDGLLGQLRAEKEQKK